ncbi:MAG TPA: hypothetical protein VL688_12215 [Verrucomicrobiae bacterium]|nr:hypothetical protein [Verrucomicrobiae bacterium]
MKLWAFLGLLALLPGCGWRSWQASYHMVRAEHAAAKAYELRVKKDSHDARLALYKKACDDSVAAYQLSPSVFTLTRIEMAQDACFRVENHDAREMFLEFMTRYEAEHPTEVTYGDAFPQLEA